MTRQKRSLISKCMLIVVIFATSEAGVITQCTLGTVPIGVNFNNSDFAVWAANGGGSAPWLTELLDTRLFYSRRWWCLSEIEKRET